MPEREATLAKLLATPPGDLKDLTLELMSGWYERVFVTDEPAVRTVLAADARAKRNLLGTDPERLVLIATGIKYSRRGRFTKFLLVPTLVMRPWVGNCSRVTVGK